MTTAQTDVLIVGGGPVGLALSIDLTWRGVPHMLIERDAREARRSYPRMDQVGIRSMEHLRRLGLVEAVESAGFPRDLPRDIVFETAALGYELEREPVECDAHRAPPDCSPQKSELCPQDVFDPALQRAAEARGTGHIRYRTRLTGLAEDGEGVRCTVVDEESGVESVVTVAYVAGCDGANSRVARLLGVGAASSSTLARSTNIFIDCPALAVLTEGRRAYRHILYGPEGVWGSFVNIDGAALWRLQVLGGLDQTEWTQEEARRAIERAIGKPIDYRIAAVIPWVRRELIADAFRKGRCFLVGDAAHQFSPTGGYGMNTGLAEAFDLSWKLSAVLAGWGGMGLLDSYEAERRPIAAHNARQATENFANMRATPGDPRVLESTPEGEAARLRAGRALRRAMRDEWESLGVHLGYDYAASPIICAEKPGSGLRGRESYQPNAQPGARAPHVAWGGGSILDLFGTGFVLLVFGPGVVATDRFEAAAVRCGAPLRVVRIDDFETARLYERRLVLVRPDGHVCWRGDEQPADAGAVVDRVRGATARACSLHTELM